MVSESIRAPGSCPAGSVPFARARIWFLSRDKELKLIAVQRAGVFGWTVESLKGSSYSRRPQQAKFVFAAPLSRVARTIARRVPRYSTTTIQVSQRGNAYG